MRLRRNEERIIGELEELPELIQHIQSFLPEKEAARSSVLSKSWQHAWHTTPILRFHKSVHGRRPLDELVKLVDETLCRYGRHNLGIEGFDLEMIIRENHGVLASLVQKWVNEVATKHYLKQFLLLVCTNYDDDDSFKQVSLDLIFSSKKVEMVRVIGNTGTFSISHPVINCQYSLRVLQLRNVHVNGDHMINNLFSCCRLLEKVLLQKCKGFKKLKVENHGFLREFFIFPASNEQDEIVEINHVPSLRIFSYLHFGEIIYKPCPFNIDAFQNLKCLQLGGLIMDNAFFNMLKSGFPCLEWLILVMRDSWLTSIDITCVNSLKTLWLSACDETLTHVKVDAPAKPLCCFRYDGPIIPALCFPTNAPQKIEFQFNHQRPSPHNILFFVHLRRLALKSKLVDIKIDASKLDSLSVNKIDVDELKRVMSSPRANVQNLAIKITTSSVNDCTIYSSFFEAFFTICHPKYVLVVGDVDLFEFVVWVLTENKFPCLENMDAELIERDGLKRSPHWSSNVELSGYQTSWWTNFLDATQISEGWSYLKLTLTWSSNMVSIANYTFF